MPLHQFTTGVQAPFGFQPTVPYPVDSWSGPYSAGSTTAAVALANSTVPDAIRFLSLEVRILAPNPGSPGQTLAYKYWYRGSTANDGLVEFSSASSTSTDSGVTLAVAGAGIVLSPAGGTGTVTFINNGVLSFNGKTGAVSGASLGANTFSELNTFNAGITTAFLYASTGSTFGGTLQVNGGTTLGARVDIGGILDVIGGATMESTLDVSGNSKFNGNVTLGNANTDTVTATATFQGLTVSNGLLIANAGITTAFLYASTGSTFGARVDVGGILDVAGGVTLETTLDVGGVAKFVGGVTFQSTTDHGGVARFAAGLTTSALDVQGVSKFNGNITLGDAAADTITATATFQGLTVSNGLLIANAGITTAFLYASTGSTFGGTLRVNGGATFGARVDVAGVLDVAGGVTLETTLDVGGAARFALGSTFSGIAAFTSGITTSNIYASNGSTFGGTLVVNGGATFATTDHAGVARFAAGLTTSTLDVSGAARFAGGSTFSGIAAFTSGITTSFLYASTGSTFGARVDVAGILDVVGGVTLENTLDVSGVARFTAGITTSTLNASQAIRANGGLTASTLDVTTVSKFTGGATFSSSADFASAARFAVGLTSSGDVVVGSAGTVFKTNGDATIGATLNVNGNFYVTGTITTVNQANLSIDDKTITLGRTLDNDSLADGGGLILNSATDRTLTWNLASDAWTSSVNYRVLGSNGYKVDSTTVLASGMVHGLSLSPGIITGGTWAANLIGLTYGGTNKNLAAVGASGGIVFKDETGLSITSAGAYGQILQAGHHLSGSPPGWVNTTSLTGLTADRVKTNDTNSGIYYLTFVTGAAASTDLYVDQTAGVTYNAASGVLSCVQLEAIVDGGTW